MLAGTHCQIFPADNYWHADIRGLPVDPHSAQWLAAMGASTRKLHPDFGPSYGAQSAPYGIPITVATAGHPRVPVKFDYSDESDQLGYPLGADTAIEGGPTADGDRHAIVVTADTCELFETYDTHSTSSGWTAGSGAHWSLASDAPIAMMATVAAIIASVMNMMACVSAKNQSKVGQSGSDRPTTRARSTALAVRSAAYATDMPVK